MSKRIRELRQHVENKITDHERKRDALVRQRDALINAKNEEHFPTDIPPELLPPSHGAGGWLGVFERLTITTPAAA